MAARAKHEPAPIDILRRIPFVRELTYVATPNLGDRGSDGEIHIQTPSGQFQLLVEQKRSFLTRSTVSQLLAWVKHADADTPRERILLAHHIPRPVAERLIEAQINFADDVGNIHLAFGNQYNWTVLGKPAAAASSERRPVTPAQLQLLFQFVTNPESVAWPVRRLESAAGISKSKAAQARKELVAEGLLQRTGKEYQLGPKNLLSDRLTSGYADVLRPKLLLGRFRFAERNTDMFLKRLSDSTSRGIRYALTGGPAADLLQHFYHGPEIPMFIEPFSRKLVSQELRILPDRSGPVILLRAFGEVAFWQQRDHHMLAPPWLIYAELLNSDDPRAHEAAKELQQSLSL
jgi:hypothetical protein